MTVDTRPELRVREPSRRATPLALRLGLEFMTIVAGVLVALAVDQWVRGREDRALEREYLARLEHDLLADSVVSAEAVDAERGYGALQMLMLERVSVGADGALMAVRRALR